MTYITDIDITHRHTFGISTRAHGWCDYESVQQLVDVLCDLRNRNIPFMPIGQGSNLLFVRDYPGVLLHSVIDGITVVDQLPGHVLVRAGSGVVWDNFVAYCVEAGWGGVENLSHIPGTVGASAVQNIGAYGVEVCRLISDIEAVDVTTGDIRHFAPHECRYGYRTSIFKQELRGRYIVTAVTYKLQLQPHFHLDYGNLRQAVGDAPTLRDVRNAVIDVRRRKLPEVDVMGSAGSFFVNPVIPRNRYEQLLATFPLMPHYDVDGEHVKVPAGWLIDNLGWRGKRQGGAMVYEKQCLVLVNTGTATARDVVALAANIAQSVSEAYGIEIKPEVNYIG